MKPMAPLPVVLAVVALLAGCAGPAEQAPETTGSDVLTGFLCSADDSGHWRGKAILTNVGETANAYTVRFSVVRTSSSEVLGMKEDNFTLEPGESVDVAFTDIHSGNSDGLECVPRVTAEPSA